LYPRLPAFSSAEQPTKWQLISVKNIHKGGGNFENSSSQENI
jgi:hypothetical protein